MCTAPRSEATDDVYQSVTGRPWSVDDTVCVNSTVRRVGLTLNVSNVSVENLLSEASSLV
jgi:hypothetical protein